ncbi:MAG TPA: aminopeptidase P N-terminal domain-containing protein [Puia sp.]|nr:aminopeptidase P N-terminal domain-containing protein [Puia sp.]
MKKITIPFLSLIFSFAAAWSQDLQEPVDYLGKDFHAGRRDALRKLMPDHSVAIIFAYPERVFSKDVNYVYHANPDLYYFSGYKEPDAVLLIFKEPQQMGATSCNELFFVRKRDPQNEQWTGRRLGVEGVKNRLGFSQVYAGADFDSLCPDLSHFSQLIFDALPDDISHSYEAGSLFDMVRVFRKKANIPAGYTSDLSSDLRLIEQYGRVSNLDRALAYLQIPVKVERSEVYRNNEIVRQLMQHPDSAALESVKSKIRALPKSPEDLFDELTSGLREIKMPEELVLLEKSVEISSIAHAEAMKAIRPAISERELEGILTYVHKKYGAEEEGYPPIVGAGANGCILHYEENNTMDVQNQLVLMDVAAEYHGYSADVTRTVPSAGKFSPVQKAIYDLVYNAQEEIFKLCREGTPFQDLNKKANEVLADGLLRLGILKNREEVYLYYPHGCSHHMGLDVHDKNNGGPLRPNMVITVEPGIYIPAGSPCDKKWWNIGVRIEDDVLIGSDRCTLLSAAAPRKAEDVEKMIARKSPLETMALPALHEK